MPEPIQSQAVANDSGLSLAGRTALVTGGTTGIGRASALLFHTMGAKVIVTGNNPDRLAEARCELPRDIAVFQSDARSIESAARLAHDLEAQVGALDVAFLNAGIAGLMPLEAVTEAFYDDQMNTNVKGVVFTLQKLLPILRPGASVIVNTSVANQKGLAAFSIYSATKGAVAAFVRSMAVELAPRKIRINSICPAMIHTPIQAKFGIPPEMQQQIERDFSTRIPLGRYGEAAEVASLALFLASPAASFITGAEFPVDGGLSIA